MTRFWVKVFGLTFALGVASGIVLEFEFGTNWARYSRYVGDVFGSALAAEGIFAFFLESGFLALLLFGWKKVKPAVHFFATVMVALGAHFSAIWIIVANSWMQTPAGHHIVSEGGRVRAEVADFWGVVFNPSTIDRLSHTLLGAWQAGAFLVISVSAYYFLKHRHQEAAKAGMRIGLIVAVVASLGSLITGHGSAVTVAETQPPKLAAMEGHFGEGGQADMYLWGFPLESERRVALPIKVPVPGMLNLFVHGDPDAPVPGLAAFPEDTWPPVAPTFYAFHLMVMTGMALIAISLLGLFFCWRGSLFEKRWLLYVMVPSVALPHLANQLGWIVAEVGRQPWIVYGMLKTSDAVSVSVGAGEILASLVLFGLVYAGLFAVFIYLLDAKIKQGPSDPKTAAAQQESQP
jgi:cytochrome d ubiquinol oxidase subunit I